MDVAVVDDAFEIEGTHIPEEHLTYELNEWDDYAIETAIQLQEARDDVDVVAAAIGPERSEETLRKALAKGADRAVRVWDDALDDVSVLSPAAKARLLAAVAEREEADLILTGVQSGDDAWGATGVALARELSYQWAAVVNQLELDGDTARVHRELEGGVEERTELDLPAVLTIQTGINDPRYASLRGIRQAHRKPLDVLSLADLGADAPAEPLRLREMRVPESESDTEYLEGSPADQAERLAGLLAETGVVDG